MSWLTVDHPILDVPAPTPVLVARVLYPALRHSRPVYLELPRNLVSAPCEPVPAPMPQPFDPAIARVPLTPGERSVVVRLGSGASPAALTYVTERREHFTAGRRTVVVFDRLGGFVWH